MTRRIHTRSMVLAAALLGVASIGLAPAGGSAAAGSPRPAVAIAPTLAQLVGQRMLISFQGTSPDAALLSRIRAGQVGGVILFGSNITGATQLANLTAKLQAAARAGGRPPLLVATDQEGGLVRRLSWAPPNYSAQQLGTYSASNVQTVGHNTGVALRAAGVNLDLAPVADVPRTPSNFILAQHRAFATNRYTVANDAAAFALGLEAGGVQATYKHFPGLGRAGATSTDDALVKITANASQISYDLLPYRVALTRTVRPVVMLSTAVYPAYSIKAAAWSPRIAVTLLRTEIGFHGVTVTDSLTSAAAVRGTTPMVLAVRSATVGVDLLLVTGSELTSKAAYEAVLAQARSGAIPLANLKASYNRILALKSRL
ncbi:MAG: beta-N-acetylhexosaminidase [Gaiellales bacterium]|nr:beta-N-acetylhexosaminidase [Gaiellales bacterium]